jgi:glycosyltransferase involved in cell wall biosynthesis
MGGDGEVRQIILLAKVLSENGFQASIVTGDYWRPDVDNCAKVSVYKIPNPGMRGIKGAKIIYLMLSDTISVLRIVSPDVVHFCVRDSRAAAAAWYARRFGKRVAYQCGSNREFAVPIPAMPSKDSILYRWGMHRAGKIIVQNLIQQDQSFRNYGRQGDVIPTLYAEVETYKARPSGSVLWVGTLKPIKRADFFIELARRRPDQAFVMVGGPDISDGPDHAYFNRMRESAMIVKNLRFAGYVPFREVGRVFEVASLFANTSDSEGFQNTFIQAWIRGIPSLSFVVPETVPSKTGTIRCGNLDNMSPKIEVLATDVVARTKAGASTAANFADTHSIAAPLPRYHSLFRSVVHDGGA